MSESPPDTIRDVEDTGDTKMPVEETEKEMRVGAGASSKKIKFKRAKKLKKFHKAVGANYMKHYNDLNRSRFEDWSKGELVQLLVECGFELRNEQGLELISLRDLTEAIYLNKPMPPKPVMMSFQELILVIVTVRKIQNKWIDYMVRKRRREEEHASMEYIQRIADMEMEPDSGSEEIGNLDALYSHGLVKDDGASQKEIFDRIAKDHAGSEKILGSRADPSAEPARRQKKRVNVLDMEWTAPSWPKAELYADHVQPRQGGKGGTHYDFYKTTTGRHCCLGGLGEQFDLWEEGQISEFSMYGAGITNYFKFLKWCAWIFVVVAIISLPSLVLNIFGPNEANHGLQDLARSTIGNLVSTLISSNTTDTSITSQQVVHIPGCSTYGIYHIDCAMDPNELGRFYMGLDLAIMCVFIVGYMWLVRFEKYEEKSLVDSNTVNASMFTIRVSNLPPNATEDDVSSHFKRLLQKQKDKDSKNRSRKEQPLDYSVAAVAIAYDNLVELKECESRGSIIKAKVRLVHKHRYDCTSLQKSGAPQNVVDAKTKKSRESLMAEMKKQNEALQEREANLEKFAEQDADAIYAFVTFNKVEGKKAAMKLYNKMSLFSSPDAALIMGDKLLYLSDAAEPSTIMWENLTFSWSNRMLRRTLTFFLSLCFVMFSVVMVFGAKAFETTSLGKSYGVACPVEFQDMTEQDQETYVTDNPDFLFCYCDQLNQYEQARSDVCQEYLQDTIDAQIFLYCSSMVVVLVNIVLEQVMKYFAKFEKHHTQDGQAASIFMRLFVLKYINTATVFFINGNNKIYQKFGLDTVGSAKEFTAEWFNTVGVTIILVQLADIVFANSDTITQYFFYRRAIRRAKMPKSSSPPLTQDELNKLHGGRDLEIAYKYAQVMSTTFVCLTFSLGIPVLYFIAAANFITFYFMEKFFFCTLYKIPPHFNSKLGKSVSRLVPFAFIVHLSMSIWIISNQAIFGNQQITLDNVDQTSVLVSADFRSRLTGENTYPLTILLALLLLYELSRWLLHGLQLTGKCWDRLSTSAEGSVDEHDSTGQSKVSNIVTYTRAVDRSIIKGLATYNILQNPVYKDAFAITWKFAIQHRNVRSVRMLKGKAQIEDTENNLTRVESLKRMAVQKDAERNNRLSSNRSFYKSIDPLAPPALSHPTVPARPAAAAKKAPPNTDSPRLHQERNKAVKYEAIDRGEGLKSRPHSDSPKTLGGRDKAVKYEAIERGEVEMVDPML